MDGNYLRSDLEAFLKTFENNAGLVKNTAFCGQNSDQLWIDHWINNRLNSQIQSKDKSIKSGLKINDFKLELKSVLNLFSQFSEKLNDLNENINCFNEQKLISSLNDLNDRKVILQQKLSLINSKLPLIKSKINENKRKRSKKSIKNIKHKNLFNESLKNRTQEINEWFGCHERQEVIEDKRNVKRETNNELIEVKNKINAIKRQLKKANKTEKLRNDLVSKAQRRNQLISPQNEKKFYKKLNKMRTELNGKLVKLREEENSIHFKLKIESQLSSQKDHNLDDFNKNVLRIKETLFGSEVIPEPNNSESLKTYQFFERSHQNIQNMIEVRNSWDRYLDINGGTSIPKHYVMPNNRPNNEWNKYLKN